MLGKAVSVAFGIDDKLSASGPDTSMAFIDDSRDNISAVIFSHSSSKPSFFIRIRNGDLTNLPVKKNDLISAFAVLRYTSNVSNQFWNIICLPSLDISSYVRENSYYNIRRRNIETRSW